MTVLDKIQGSIRHEIDAMNEIISTSLHTDHDVVNGILDNYLKIKGKQIRPILVILAAKMFGDVNDRVLYSAAALEMLHNATLIHDDVLDQTPLRRGEPTINAVWGNHLAVLSGDIFVSKALSTAVHSGSMKIMESLSSLGTELSLGEMDQLFNARSHSLNKEAYFRMIERKTASLFRGCVKIGAQAVDADESQYIPLVEFAGKLGIAFQIRDDIFDYFPSDDIGKPSGHDLLEGKVTLPILCALEIAPLQEAERISSMLQDDCELTPEMIKEIQEFAIINHGIDMAREEMRRLQTKAMEYLSAYPDSQSKLDFERIFNFIIDRTY